MYVVFPGDGSGKVQASVKDEDWMLLAVICTGWSGTKQKWNKKNSITHCYMYIGKQKGIQAIESENYQFKTEKKMSTGIIVWEHFISKIYFR